MTRETFLRELLAHLGALSEEERTRVTEYYEELALDAVELGESEEEAVAGFGDPAAVAAQILAERGAAQAGAAQAGAAQAGAVQADAVQDGAAQTAADPREYCAQGAVHTAAVQLQDRRVQVRPSADGQLRVRFTPLAGDRVQVEEENGVFRFRHRAPLLGGLFGGWEYLMGHWDRTAVLEVPPDFAGTVLVRTTNARITVESVRGAEKLQLVSSNGRIEVRDCGARAFSLKTSNGAIGLEALRGEGCDAATSNGSITAADCAMRERLRFATSNGAIRVEDADAPELSFVSSNGAIKGSIAGREADYAVTAHTSNAHCSLQESAGAPRPRRLRAVTSNGAIRLRFLQAD